MEKNYLLWSFVLHITLTSNLGEKDKRRYISYDGEDAYAKKFRSPGPEKVGTWSTLVDGGYTYNAA
jgi:hypothetical protein